MSHIFIFLFVFIFTRVNAKNKKNNGPKIFGKEISIQLVNGIRIGL
jgi:hypothetical protein